MAAAPAIVVNGLAKSYRSAQGSVLAMRDLSFEVEQGEALALLGRNGAGKSTTVKVLATLLEPDAGKVAVGGHDVVDDPSAARGVLGVALQETGLPRRQSARRLLRHHARLYGLSQREATLRSSEAVELFELGAVADRPISTYSGGERRRLHVALALLHRPRVVLLDEPTAGLDTASCKVVWRELQDRLAQGTALLFTTHDLREAERHADRVAVVDDGRLVAHSCPNDLKRDFGSLTLTLSFAGEEDAQRALELVGRGERIHPTGVRIAMAGAEEMPRVIQLLDEEGIEAQAASLAEPTLDAIFDTLTRGRDRARLPA